MKLNLTTALGLGEEPLMNILVSSEINCTTCKHNPDCRTWGTGGLVCKEEKAFVSCPELTVCMKWVEGRSDRIIEARARRKMEEP
jgi:hypothetical protein